MRDNYIAFLQYALIISLCANAFLAAALVCVTWLSPHVDKSWLPRGLRAWPVQESGAK